jgi:hypothetical protein
MIDRKTMRSLLENMEQAAEESLHQDSNFYEALQALKWEIDNDPQVRSTMSELQAAGRKVFNSFVPHIKIRVRTAEGVFALPKPAQTAECETEEAGRLTQTLRNAAGAVIKKSRHYRKLDAIVNQAVGASDRFEGIASKVEKAGYEVLICLDLSAYAQVQGSVPPRRLALPQHVPTPGPEPVSIVLSGADRNFLKSLKIKVDES